MFEISPICRGKNLTLETVLDFINCIPTVPMPKNQFNEYAENRMKGWIRTHSQLARQMALYYEKDGYYIPRFNHKCSLSEVVDYVHKWARLYFVPNPYTPSLTGYQPTNIYAKLKNQVLQVGMNYEKACFNIFGIQLNSLDKVRVYLVNFTDLMVHDGILSVDHNLREEEMPKINPETEAYNDPEEYFKYFDKVTLLPVTERSLPISGKPCQIIYYGAPGTGKSFTIKKYTKDISDVVRTTFHPDSDYSTFVGAYKPTMRRLNDGQGSGTVHEDIAYEFVPQAFLKAYVNAWKLLATAANAEEIKPEFLIIEEINRGNCAQIFGDLFQLLDRNDEGFSNYPICADKDLQGYLHKVFDEEWLDREDKPEVMKEHLGQIYGKKSDIDKVLAGEILMLPSNLYIWATMNTSDQSLFPIDSAFKRRWDWKYIPISQGSDNNGNLLNWKIQVGRKKFDWWSFLQVVNRKIADATESQDKQLGYFFCKANREGLISIDRFVNKVVFYLWNDVFKDYDAKEVFPDDYSSFDKFFMSNGEANEEAAVSFLKKLGIQEVTQEKEAEESNNTEQEE